MVRVRLDDIQILVHLGIQIVQLLFQLLQLVVVGSMHLQQGLQFDALGVGDAGDFRGAQQQLTRPLSGIVRLGRLVRQRAVRLAVAILQLGGQFVGVAGRVADLVGFALDGVGVDVVGLEALLDLVQFAR